MPYRHETPDFLVTADGAFDTDGVWRIDVVLRFRDGITDVEKAKLVGSARLETLKGIYRAGEEGRALGATNVRVVADADREIVGNLNVEIA